MPLDAEARRLLDAVEAAGTPAFEDSTPTEARAARDALAPPVLEPCHTTFRVDIDGTLGRMHEPQPTGEPTGLLVYFHGGGWVVGGLESHDNVTHALCRRSGHRVLAVDYRLAPEHPFPAGLEDCSAAVRWAREHALELGVDPERIAVGGDSAGGNLAAVVANESEVPLRLQLLIYPVTDARMTTPSYRENGDGLFLTAAGMKWFVGHYLSGAEGSPSDPRVSPLLAGTETLAEAPPAFVITAGYDPLRDEGIHYVERLAEAGVQTAHLHYPNQIHAFFSMSHMLSDARSAIAAAAQALSDALAPDVGAVEAPEEGA